MKPFKNKRAWWSTTDWLNTRLARIGVFSALLVVFAGAIAQNSTSLKSFDLWVESFDQPIIRESYRVVADIGSLQNVVHEYYPSQSGVATTPVVELTPSQKKELVQLVDFIWIRADQFNTLPVGDELRGELDRAIVDLGRFVELADMILARPEQAYDIVPQLHDTADDVRHAFSLVVEDWRARSIDAVKGGLVRLNVSVWISNGFAIATAMLALVAFRFLSLEVKTRQAKERAEKKASKLAYFDSLTGLPNRFSFNSSRRTWADEFEAGKDAFSLALVDLDKFKEINDTLGHEAGDHVLCVQANRIQSAVNAFDGFAARLSGDEFAALLPFDNCETAAAFCQDLVERLNKPVLFNQKRIDTGGSIGLCSASRFLSPGGLDTAALTRSADYALYEAKSANGNKFKVFDDALATQFAQKSALIEALPLAIEKGEIDAFFQPKVDIATGRVVSFEALARWRKDGQLILPAEFIDVAEEIGLISQIDLTVLQRAVDLISAYNMRHGTQISVSSNLSAKHFLRKDIVVEIQKTLDASGLPPELLTLEITETRQLSDWNTVGQVLNSLRGIGCSISIDDFGTGYSSLSYLRTMQADEVKIDRSFVVDLETSTQAQFMLDAIIDIATELGMRTVVEGIETEEQARLVHKMGCRLAQGYLYSLPIAADELEDIFMKCYLGPSDLFAIRNETKFPRRRNFN